MCDLQHTRVALFPTQRKFYHNMTIASQCVQSHCLHVHMVPGHALPVTVCVFMQLLSGRVVILLLLFLSGDIETNPGPVGESSIFVTLCMLKLPLMLSYVALYPSLLTPAFVTCSTLMQGGRIPQQNCMCVLPITNMSHRMTEHFDTLRSECHFTAVQKKCATLPYVHPMSKCVMHVISLPGLPPHYYCKQQMLEWEGLGMRRGDMWAEVMSVSSLVPRPKRGRRKGPGIHCLHMLLIGVKFYRHCRRSWQYV